MGDNVFTSNAKEKIVKTNLAHFSVVELNNGLLVPEGRHGQVKKVRGLGEEYRGRLFFRKITQHDVDKIDEKIDRDARDERARKNCKGRVSIFSRCQHMHPETLRRARRTSSRQLRAKKNLVENNWTLKKLGA